MSCQLHLSAPPGVAGTLQLAVLELGLVTVTDCPWPAGVSDVYPVFGADQNFDPPQLRHVISGPGYQVPLGAADNAALTLRAIYRDPTVQTVDLAVLWDAVTGAPKLLQFLANQLLAGSSSHDSMLDTILGCVRTTFET